MIIANDPRVRVAHHHGPAYQAFWLLRIVFFVALVLAGLDKFLALLTHWGQYLSPLMASAMNGKTDTFFICVGVLEIIIGVGALLKPKIFGWVIAVWLFAIVINLLSMGSFLDIALRDLGLCLAAIALALLGRQYQHAHYAH